MGKQTIQPIDYENRLITGLSCMIWGRTENAGGPVVFLIHGLTGCAQNMFNYAAELANEGMISIVLDQRNHGMRMVDYRYNQRLCPERISALYGIYVGTSRDITSIIDFLPASVGIHTDRIGMTGFSLGGHATFMTMAHEQRIKVGVPFIGSADRKMQLSIRAAQEKSNEGSYSPEMETLTQRLDPVNNLNAFVDRPLCMINGAADQVVALEPNIRFEKKLRPLYHHQDRLKLSVYPDVGHTVTDSMWQEGKAWLKHWLLESDPEAKTD